MTNTEIQSILLEHAKWLQNNQCGKRANLSGVDLRAANLSGANLRGANLIGATLSGADLCEANLTWANLSGADLCGAKLTWADLSEANLSGADLGRANLSGANLSGANLSGSKGITYAQCSFSGHGERGRQLLAVRVYGDVVLFCSCFRGSPDELRAYISAGEERYRATRTLAMDFVLAAIDAKNKPHNTNE